MALYANSSGTWTLIPEQDGKVWCNNGGVWTKAKEVWAAEETTPGNYVWARAWKVPEPPDGVNTVNLEQWDDGGPVFEGGDVRASWTNAAGSDGFTAQVEIRLNSVSQGTFNASGTPGTFVLYDRSFLSNGDEVEARMRYFLGATVGTWGNWNGPLTYVEGF